MDTLNLENRKQLRDSARLRLNSAEMAGKIILVYAAVIVGASLLTNLLQLLLGNLISRTGGLQNLTMRSVLSTIQSIVPLILNFLLIALSLGFTGAMLRIGRGQYASLNSLRIGFDRFWVLLRATILKGGLYALALMASYMIAMPIFLLTPLSNGILSLMTPMMQNSQDPLTILNDPAAMGQLMGSVLPLYLLFGVIFLAIAGVLYYRLILTNYILLDKPGTGALAAMSSSRMLMRGNGLKFLKLDLSLWPYYISSFLAVVLLYGNTILYLLGVELPFSPLAGSLLFFAIHLAATFLITVFLQPHMEVTHALAYESLRPKESSSGVVLGNIFDLARDQINEQP